MNTAAATFTLPERTRDPFTIVRAMLLVGAFALLTVVALPWGRALIVEAGHNIPQSDMETDYLWGLGWAAFLSLTFFLWPVSRAERRTLFWLWLAKVEMMLGFMLLYEWNYGLDAYSYWADAPISGIQFSDLSFGDGTPLIYYLSRLHSDYLVSGSYHAEKMTFGYIGLVGTVVFYFAACAFLRKRDTRILWILGLTPSTLQWASIIGKDPLAYFCIGLYALGVVRLYRKPGFWPLLAIVAGVFGAAAIRPWMAAILLAPLAAFAVVSVRGLFARGLVAVLAAAGFFAALGVFSDTLHVSSVDDVIEQSESVAQSFDAGGSARSSDIERDNSVGKMIAFLPLGIVSALVRPLPGEVPNVFGFLASLENVILVWLMVNAFRRSHWADLRDPVLLWAIALVFTWASVYGFVCYHNAGTGVRYRFQIFPILFCLVAYLARRRTPA